MTAANAVLRGRNQKRIVDRLRATPVAAACLTGAFAAVLLLPAGAAAQARQSAAPAKTAMAAKAWTKKTPDGQPDLQGFWSSSTAVPLERPVNCGTKEFWTDEEIAKGVRTCTAPESA